MILKSQENFYSQIIISDASCLIALTNIGLLDALKKLGKSVIVTDEVAAEFKLPLPEWIIVKTVKDTAKTIYYQKKLDLGESSSLALACETENALLILDDGPARKYAMELGFKMTGTLGLLIRSYERGFITDLKTAVSKLKEINFRLPKDIDDIVQDA